MRVAHVCLRSLGAPIIMDRAIFRAMPESPILIDARGLKCPRPIIELAKARRIHPAGSVLEIFADDMAFESDVRAWCETTGNLLLSLGRQDGASVARIELR